MPLLRFFDLRIACYFDAPLSGLSPFLEDKAERGTRVSCFARHLIALKKFVIFLSFFVEIALNLFGDCCAAEAKSLLLN